ncbi:MAG: glycosyltransferase family 4 protein [Phycisphaerae bacterium]
MSERNPHILFINEFYWPDVCASAAVFTDHLPKIAAARPDWRISVLTGDRAWDGPHVRWPSEERHGAIEVHRVRHGPVRRTLHARAYGFARFHLAAVRRGRGLDRPDVVVATTAPPAGARIGLAVSHHHRCPMIYKVYDLYPDCAEALQIIRPGGWVAGSWEHSDRAAMHQAQSIVAISHRMAERIVHHRGLSPAKVECIHDGFDAARLEQAQPDAFRREHRLEGRFVVQYAGNMGLSHPFDTILGAAAKLSHQPDVAFQLIGAGPARKRVESALRERPLPVQLLDYQPAERLGDLLASADVGLVSQNPAMSELSLPYKVYGLMAAGKPAIFIGDARSEIADWYRTHDCGIHIAQGDVDGLVRAILRIKNDPLDARRLSDNARRVFAERFDSRVAVRKWIESIEDLLPGREHRDHSGQLF